MADEQNYPEQVYEELGSMWDWLEIGDVTVIKGILVCLALLAVAYLLRNILRGIFFGSLGGYSPPPRRPFQDVEDEWSSRPKKRPRTGFEQVDPRIYDFTVKTPPPDLSAFRQSSNISHLRDNIDLGRLRSPSQPNWNLAQDLFVPKMNTKRRKRRKE